MKYQRKDLAAFASQVQYVLNQYTPHQFKAESFNNIILCGLGGSGIAGRIMKASAFNRFPLPVEVISDYDLPAYVNEHTLAIQCSYSGNTEETLSMYAQAKQKGAKMICIATGGKLLQLAEQDNVPFYRAETGFQPRMALGYSLTFLYLIFDELAGTNRRAELEEAAKRLSDESNYISQAEKIVDAVKGSFPNKFVVITDRASNAIGLRFCQQLQENAKAEAFLHELPESNHNVIESYYGRLDTIFFLLNSHSHARTDLRFDFLEKLLHKNGNTLYSLDINVASVTDVLDSIYMLDWLSLLFADMKSVNSSNIENINALKDYLSDK